MERIRMVAKGKKPPGVGGDERKEKEKPTDQKQGDMALRGVVEAHGTFRKSTRNHSEMTCALEGDTSAEKAKNRDQSPLLEGSKKQTAVEGEYNCFTITSFHLCILYTTPYHHLVISPCEHGCILCIILPY